MLFVLANQTFSGAVCVCPLIQVLIPSARQGRTEKFDFRAPPGRRCSSDINVAIENQEEEE